MEGEGYRVSRKHQLLFEPKQIHSGRAVLAVERTKGLNFFGVLNELIAHGELRRHMFF